MHKKILILMMCFFLTGCTTGNEFETESNSETNQEQSEVVVEQNSSDVFALTVTGEDLVHTEEMKAYYGFYAGRIRDVDSDGYKATMRNSWLYVTFDEEGVKVDGFVEQLHKIRNETLLFETNQLVFDEGTLVFNVVDQKGMERRFQIDIADKSAEGSITYTDSYGENWGEVTSYMPKQDKPYGTN